MITSIGLKTLFYLYKLVFAAVYLGVISGWDEGHWRSEKFAGNVWFISESLKESRKISWDIGCI